VAASEIYTSTLRLPRETADRLQVAAIVTGRTITNLITEATTALVDDLEQRPELAAGYARLRATVERAAKEGR
jgi:predicted DNA-binding protein